MPTGNPYTSAQAPAVVQMLAPDIATQQTQLTRQQRMADILREQSLQQDQGTQVINGWAVKKSPWEGIAKLGQALAASSLQSKVDEKQLALAKALQGRMGDFLGGGSGNGGGNVNSPDAATTALAQGAAAQPSVPDETGAMVNQGGVGPTVQNAARMDALPPAQPAQQATPNNFSMGNLLKGQVIASLGGDQAGSAYWDQFKPTDAMRNDKYLGITPDQSKASELAKRLKEGYIAPTSLRGQAYMTPDGKISTLPDAAQPGYMNKLDQATGQWSTVPIAGGVESVQESEKAKKLGQTLGTLGQGVDATGAPTYFLGVPSGTAGAPAPSPQMQPPPAAMPSQGMRPPGAAPQPGATAQPPAAGPIDLNHMTPEQNKALMAQAEAQFGLRPGATPGRSVQGPAPAPAQAAPAPAAVNQPGMIRPGNAPGQNEFMQSRAAAAGKRDNDLVATAADSPTRVNVLDNIIQLSESGVKTGPSAEWQNAVKSAMTNIPGIDMTQWKDEVTGYQELNKFLKQNGIRAWQAAGGSGTDSQLSAAMEANPNGKMNPKAVQLMARWGKAGEIALQGKANAAQAANISTPAAQSQFEANWRQNMDPRIFQMKTMDPTEAQAFVANLKKTDPAGYQTLLKKAQTLKQMGAL